LKTSGEDIDRACILAALGGDASAMRKVVDTLAPVVQSRVARALVRRGGISQLTVRQELEDYVQESFANLFSGGGRALLGWDPLAGRSLRNYVGQRVEWFIASRLRIEPLPITIAELFSAPDAFEQRDSLRRLLVGIERKWSQFGVRLFYLLFVLESPSKDVSHELGMSCDAVDKWRCRLRDFARGLLLEEDA
jgi:hypothetical protein